MEKFSISKRLYSFKNAFNGIRILFKSEHNAWIHGSLTICAIALGVHFQITGAEWIAIIFSIAIVLSAEIFNTAIEHIANFIQPKHDIKIKHIKDLSAGGVLICAISALLVGLIIFLPKIINLISG